MHLSNHLAMYLLLLLEPSNMYLHMMGTHKSLLNLINLSVWAFALVCGKQRRRWIPILFAGNLAGGRQNVFVGPTDFCVSVRDQCWLALKIAGRERGRQGLPKQESRQYSTFLKNGSVVQVGNITGAIS